MLSIDTDIFKSTVRRESPDRYFQFVARLERFIKARRLAFRMRLYRVQCHFLCQLGLLKFLFSVLRRFRPVFVISNKLLVVTRAREVREVLERFDDFTLGESIEPGMPWGNFLMTVDWRQRHAQERKWLKSAVDESADAARLTAIVAQRCHQQIAAAKGQIDVVSELLEPVVVDIADKYFGVPPLGGNARDMAHAMRDLAGIIMVKPPIDSVPWSRSRSHIAKITELVLNEITATSSAGSPPAARIEPVDQRCRPANVCKQYSNVLAFAGHGAARMQYPLGELGRHLRLQKSQGVLVGRGPAGPRSPAATTEVRGRSDFKATMAAPTAQFAG